jgi:hypothetical protein
MTRTIICKICHKRVSEGHVCGPSISHTQEEEPMTVCMGCNKEFVPDETAPKAKKCPVCKAATAAYPSSPAHPDKISEALPETPESPTIRVPEIDVDLLKLLMSRGFKKMILINENTNQTLTIG